MDVVAYKSLNTHEKLERKFKNWIMPSSVCGLCYQKEESLDHLFFYCSFATRGWQAISKEFGVDC